VAWANVQSGGTFQATAGTTLALAYGSPVVAGNRLIAVCIWTAASGAATTCTVTDSQGNTWTAIPETLATSVNNRRSQIFHAPAGSSTADTVTMTLAASVGERVICLTEVSGLSGSLGAAVVAATGTAANPTANITVGAASSLIVGGGFSASTATVGTGYSLIAAPDGNIGEYRLPAGTGAQAVSFTATSAEYTLSGAEFLASGAAAAAPTRAPRRSNVAVQHAATWMRRRSGIVVPRLWTPRTI
jgi:hypothetical protein